MGNGEVTIMREYQDTNALGGFWEKANLILGCGYRVTNTIHRLGKPKVKTRGQKSEFGEEEERRM